MINLMQLPANEAERLAHAEGFTGTAELFARLSDAEHRVHQLEAALEAIADGGRLGTLTANQCAAAAREVLP